MSKLKRAVASSNKGFEAFNKHFVSAFGKERWSRLLPLLMSKNRVIAFANPWFDRFELKPKQWHPRGQWCDDSELYGCMEVPLGDKSVEEMGNFLHPSHLRRKFDGDAWVREAEWRAEDEMWFDSAPDYESTYLDDSRLLANFNLSSNLQILKLSHKDLDPYYLLDAASVRVARLLETRLGSLYLDMCASPGGKTLVVADKFCVGVMDAAKKRKVPQTNGELNPKLVANEFAFKRIANLRHVLGDFIPQKVRKQRIVVTNFDAKVWGLAERCKYDAILLDAPCTGERHLLREKNGIQKWSLKRCENNSKSQLALLLSAIEALRVGGHLVYATCALSDLENDAVIAQALDRKKGKIEVEPLKMNVGEATRFGWRILPDLSDRNEGPLYACRIVKRYG